MSKLANIIRMKKLLILYIYLLSINNLFSQTTGSLDPSFGNSGVLITDIGSYEMAGDMKIQNDGKILTTGSCKIGNEHYFTLIRYETDGQLDNFFGSFGITTTLIDQSCNANALTIQDDGKIVVVGSSFNGATRDFAVARYNSNGILDNTFGNSGVVVTEIRQYLDFATDVIQQSDGKIIVVGYSQDSNLNDDFVIARYNSNGVLDNSFGVGGKVITTISNSDDLAVEVCLTQDDKILVAGYSVILGNVLVQYTSDGNLDTSFGNNGISLVEVGNSSSTSAMILLDSIIYVVGRSLNGTNHDFLVLKYQSNGQLDTTFGYGGIVVTEIAVYYNAANDISIQSDGKILVAGIESDGSEQNIVLARYNDNGTLDNSFDLDGIVITSIGTAEEWVNAVEVQNDGKILLFGNYWNGSQYDFITLRYFGDETGIVEHSTIVYPNPSSEYISIDIENINYIEIYNELGQLVMKVRESKKIYIGDFSNGIYICKIDTPQKSIQVKFIKK